MRGLGGGGNAHDLRVTLVRAPATVKRGNRDVGICATPEGADRCALASLWRRASVGYVNYHNPMLYECIFVGTSRNTRSALVHSTCDLNLRPFRPTTCSPAIHLLHSAPSALSSAQAASRVQPRGLWCGAGLCSAGWAGRACPY